MTGMTGADDPARGDYLAMVRRALELYEGRMNRRQVLRECYGVDFPEEFFTIVDSGLDQFDWGATLTDLPWQLAIPPDRGGPDEGIPYAARLEGELLARDENLVPLAVLVGRHSTYGGRVACYRLSDLAAGDESVALILEDLSAGTAPGAPSLLQMLRLHFADLIDRMHQQLDDPANARASIVEPEDIAEADSHLRRVEEMIDQT